MKTKLFFALLLSITIFSSFSTKEGSFFSEKNKYKRMPPSSCIGYYVDGSTSNKVYIWINTSNNVVGAKLNSSTSPYSNTASGTYSSGSVTNFHAVISSHTYDYSGALILL